MNPTASSSAGGRTNACARLALAALCVLLVLPASGALAGNRDSPEVLDPTGDTVISHLPEGSGWADLEKMWFENWWKITKKGKKTIKTLLGFKVNVQTLGFPEPVLIPYAERRFDFEAAYKTYWTIQGPGECTAEVTYFRTSVKREEWANMLDYKCFADAFGTESYSAPVSVSFKSIQGRGYATITIPLTVFSKGSTKGRYKPGATLISPRVQSFLAKEKLPRLSYVDALDRAPGYPVHGDIGANVGRDFILGK